MARIRTIKPEFFLHEGIGSLTPLHAILFEGLWVIADREGRLEDRPQRIKLQTIPYWDADTGKLLTDLQEIGVILRYEVDGQKLIQIVKFKEHQRPHPKEPPSVLPEPYDTQKPWNGDPSTRQNTEEPRPDNVETRSSREKDMPGRVGSGILDPGSMGSGSKPSRAAAPPDAELEKQVLDLFGLWCKTCGHPTATLDDKREKLLRAAIKTYGFNKCCAAITGCASSPFHMGQNTHGPGGRGKRYDKLSLIFRDAEQVDQFVGIRLTPDQERELLGSTEQPTVTPQPRML